MSFESFQLNLKLTNTGYNKVMALDGKPVALKYIALGKGNAAGTAGYNVDFRDTKTALLHEVIRKQIDSSQKTSYTDANGTPLARLDFAAIFNDNSSFDVWEMGFFDDVGDLIYIWSHPTNVFAPKRPNIHLAISISQHLLFAEEASGVIVQDAGVPFELFLQPLKDDFDSVIASAFSLVAADALNLMMRDIDHDEEIVSAKSRLATEESKLNQASSALPAISKRIDDAKSSQIDQQKELLRLLAWKQATDAMYIRARGWSGLLAVRQYTYHGGTDNLRQIASSEKGTPGHIHNHPEFGDLLGTGEVWAVINGWQFKARHRDHHLESPAPAGSAFLATQKLLPPALPPSVTGTVEEQTTAILDLYRRYAAGEFPTGFRADLTALEVWLEPYSETFSDTFHSQRHTLQASNLTDALRGLLHYSASGLKDRFENQSVEMPLVAWIDASGDPKLAILRYRMICTSLESMGDVRQHIKSHEDVMFNIGWGRDSGRFQVAENQDSPGALDTMMGLLPGLNGAGAMLTETHTRYGQSESIRTWSDGATPINAAYYNRFAQAMGDDAANRHHFIRGDYDPYLFVASNTRAEVLDMAFAGNPHRWSWAIPMEIVIRHPFESWNPYNIPTVSDSGNYSTAGTQANPIRGLNPAVGAFFMTPAGVYSGASHADEADTATGEYWVTCGDGVARKMRASGIWIKSPPIAGVGSIRLRYPIHPEHQEGDKAYATAVAVSRESASSAALMMADSLLARSKAIAANSAIAQAESAIATNGGKITQLQQRSHQHKELTTLELISNDTNSDTLMYRNQLVNPPTPPEIEMITPPRGFSMSMTTPPPEMTPEGGLVYSNINEVSFSVSEPALSLMPSDISYHWIVTPTDLTSPDRVHSIGGGVSFSETANEPKKLYCWAQNALGDKSKIIAVRG